MTTDLGEEVHNYLKHIKHLHGRVPKADLLEQIDKLQKVVIQLKKEGISMWNANSQIPKIFDVVDGAFEVMVEIVRNQKEEEPKK